MLIASAWRCLWVAISLLPLARELQLDRVVAVVDKEVVTASRLMAESRLALAYRRGEIAAASVLDEELLLAFRRYVIEQMLVAGQIRKLGGVDVSEEQINARIDALMQRFSSSASYHAFRHRFGLSEEMVRDIAARDLRNEAYLQMRIRARLLTTANPNTISKQRYEAAVQRWIEELYQSAEVRVEAANGLLEMDRH